MTKAGKQVSANDEGIQEWKQWLQAKHSESTVPSLLSKMEAAANPSFGDDQAVCSPSWRHKGSEISSAVGVAVRKTVDSLMAPLDGRKAAENFESPAAKQRVSSLSEDAPQFLAQQLLGELEKAAAKVNPISKECRSCLCPILCLRYRNGLAFMVLWCWSPGKLLSFLLLRHWRPKFNLFTRIYPLQYRELMLCVVEAMNAFFYVVFRAQCAL